MDDVSERWEPIPDFPGYQVSNMGKVKSLPRPIMRKGTVIRTSPECILKPSRTPNGYWQVVLSHNGRQKNFRVQYLVLRVFVGEKPKDHVAVFRNGDSTDCRLVNLTYGKRQRALPPAAALPPLVPPEIIQLFEEAI
jgi:hypothetical protein